MQAFSTLIMALLLGFTSCAQQKKIPFKSFVDSIFSKTEMEARFKGGQSEWIRFLNRNLKIPDSCNTPDNLTQLMTVQFIISAKGNLSNIEVVKSAECMKDALIQLIQLSARQWTPAMCQGRYVSSYRKIPIRIHVGAE